MTRTKPLSSLGFRLMALEYRLRDLRRPPRDILRGIGVRPGLAVLDFGCGPGSFSSAAADLVGPGGQVVAVDLHPFALRWVDRRARKLGLSQIQVIHRDALPGVPDGSIDVVLLFDVLHEIEDSTPTLAEIRRVLKQGGIVSVADHHMSEESLIQRVISDGLFQRLDVGGSPMRFVPTGPEAADI